MIFRVRVATIYGGGVLVDAGFSAVGTRFVIFGAWISVLLVRGIRCDGVISTLARPGGDLSSLGLTKGYGRSVDIFLVAIPAAAVFLCFLVLSMVGRY